MIKLYNFPHIKIQTFVSQVPKFFTLYEPCIMICICKKNQWNAHFFHELFNSIILSLTCFAHSSNCLQEYFYTQLYGIISSLYISSLVGQVVYCTMHDIIPHSHAYKSSWRWKPGCLKHVEDNIIELNH